MKIANYRIVLFASLCLLAGVLTGSLVMSKIILIIIPLVIVTGGILLIIFTKKINIAILIILFAIGFSLFHIDKVINYDGEISGIHKITATVDEVKNNGKVIIEDLKVDGLEFDGKAELELKGTYVKEGEIITFQALAKTHTFNPFDSYSSYYYSNSIYYDFDNVENLIVENGNPKIFTIIKLKIKTQALKYLSNKDAGIMMSLIFGDKSILTETDSQIIAGSGLSHVFAVSGLHVGFLAGIVAFLLKKFKVNWWVSLIITTLVLICYGFITGFPSGVKRAGITLFVYMIGKGLYRKPDSLTTLAFSAALVIVTNPREIFDVGFIMSYTAVLGISMFYKTFYSIFLKLGSNKVYKYFAQIISMTLSANLFVLPVTTNVFNTYNTYSVIGNLVILPIISVTFTFAAIVAVLTAVYSGCGILFYVLKYPIYLVRELSLAINSLPYSNLETTGVGIATIFYVIALILVSRYVLLSPKIKYPLFGVSFLSAVLCLIII